MAGNTARIHKSRTRKDRSCRPSGPLRPRRPQPFPPAASSKCQDQHFKSGALAVFKSANGGSRLARRAR